MESSPQLNIVGISPLNYSQIVSLTYVSTNNSNGDSTWTYGWSPPASISSGTVSISITGNDLRESIQCPSENAAQNIKDYTSITFAHSEFILYSLLLLHNQIVSQ